VPYGTGFLAHGFAGSAFTNLAVKRAEDSFRRWWSVVKLEIGRFTFDLTKPAVSALGSAAGPASLLVSCIWARVTAYSLAKSFSQLSGMRRHRLAICLTSAFVISALGLPIPMTRRPSDSVRSAEWDGAQVFDEILGPMLLRRFRVHWTTE
jgi:hypothetical protein